MTPKLHISACLEYPSCLSTSGAIRWDPLGRKHTNIACCTTSKENLFFRKNHFTEAKVANLLVQRGTQSYTFTSQMFSPQNTLSGQLFSSSEERQYTLISRCMMPIRWRQATQVTRGANTRQTYKSKGNSSKILRFL